MKYCPQCLQPDTRPNARFTESGVCSACHYFAELKHVDWQERYEILQDLLDRYRRKPGQYFDCIIGVSGGKDSVRQALFVREKLGLRPLLACLSYPPQQVTERGVLNISNLIELGFDTVISAPAPETWRRLMRASFDRFTNRARSTESRCSAACRSSRSLSHSPDTVGGESGFAARGLRRSAGPATTATISGT